MKFLFVYNHLELGGIETLIVRSANWLVNNKHSVKIILIRKQGQLLKQLDPRVEVDEIGFLYSELKIFYNYYKKTYNDYDVYFSFSPSNLWQTYKLFKTSRKEKKVIYNGVYHSKDFELYGDSFDRYLFDKKLPDESKIFMSEYVQKNHEKFFNRQFQKSFIWPLPINTKQFDKINRNPEKFKIVSIGRLTSFKTYNIYMLDVVKELKEKGFNVIYEIYGEGSIKKDIIKKAFDLNISNVVKCKGNIPYENILEPLSKAYVFIGMGTSVIEAGLCKVPSIAAISYDTRPITHGLIHELPNNNCGQHDIHLNEFNVIDLMIMIFSLSERDYEKLCLNSHERLKNTYDLDNIMNLFMQNVKYQMELNQPFPNISWPFRKILTNLINKHIKALKKIVKRILFK